MLNKILGLLLVATSSNGTMLTTSAEQHGVCPDPTRTPPPLTQKGKDAWSSFNHYDYWHKGDVCKIPRKGQNIDDVKAMVIDMGHNAFTTNEDWIYIKDIKGFPNNNKLAETLTACPTCHLYYQGYLPNNGFTGQSTQQAPAHRRPARHQAPPPPKPAEDEEDEEDEEDDDEDDEEEEAPQKPTQTRREQEEHAPEGCTWTKYESKDLYGIGDVAGPKVKLSDFNTIDDLKTHVKQLGYNAFTIWEGYVAIKNIRPRVKPYMLTSNGETTSYVYDCKDAPQGATWTKIESSDLYGVGDVACPDGRCELSDYNSIDDLEAHVKQLGYNAFTIWEGHVAIKNIRPEVKSSMFTRSDGRTTYVLQ